jgi:adenylate cyclase
MERKLTAILCADVHGYSRLMGENEEATLSNLSAFRKIIDGLIEQHRGRFVGSAGDSVIAEFASVVNAVQCAVEIQSALKLENANLPPERRMEFRIGVNLGDVMVEGEQIYGDGVNVAARLESLAEPGGICISNTVHDHVSTKLSLTYQDLGAQAVKNIAKPVRVFRVLLDGVPLRLETQRISRRYWRGGALSLAGLAIAIATVVIVQNLSFKSPRTSASIPPQEKPSLPPPSIPSIAVLAFTNLSGDPQQEYFSDGISDQLINSLSRLPSLLVIARNSSFSYKGKATKEHEIGKELGVKYVLEGSVRKATDRIRIGVELVDASSGTEMWTQRYDRPLKDIFAVQDEIVANVVTTLSLIFKLDQMKLIHFAYAPRTDNFEAFDDTLRASEYAWRITKGDLAKARQWNEKAIELDPKYADAYAGLGWNYSIEWLYQWSDDPKADLARASELAHKALALDDASFYALTLLSRVELMQRQFDRAVAAAERATVLGPNSAFANSTLADALISSGKPEEAILAAGKAMQLDPSGHDVYLGTVGMAYLQMGRNEEAIPVLKRHLVVVPNNLVIHLSLCIAYAELGRDQEARAEAAEVLRISPRFTLADPKKWVIKDVAMAARWNSELRKIGLK